MSDRRCSACGGTVPGEEDYCPRDGVACFPPVRMLEGVLAGEPSLVDAALYEQVERATSFADLAASADKPEGWA